MTAPTRIPAPATERRDHATDGVPAGRGPTATSASLLDTVRVAATVLGPLVARGVIVRRRRVKAIIDRVEADQRAVRLLQRLRDEHGSGLLRLRVPFRSMAVVLDPGDVRRVLHDSPTPFTPANREKRAALAHFQPHAVLITEGPERAERRRFNEMALETPDAVHSLAPTIVDAVRDEALDLAGRASAIGELTWPEFELAWWRVVRRVVLGDTARDDHALTDTLGELRAAANWAFARPRRERLRRAFDERLAEHLDRAEAGSLAAAAANAEDATSDVALAREQVPHWLFAFDAAAMATYRALALVAAHPDLARRLDQEVRTGDPTAPRVLADLRATVLESLRLWPTTPGILRDTTAATQWGSEVLPAGTGLIVYAPFFHRDETRVAAADRVDLDHWTRGTAGDWPLVPFSDGPGRCPGENLVLLVTSTFLAALLERLRLDLPAGHGFDPESLPATVDPFGLSFRVTPTG